MKKEAMARRLLHGNDQRRTLVVLSAWRAWVMARVREREHHELAEKVALAEERAEAARLQETMHADEQKQRIAERVAMLMMRGELRRLMHAWADEVHARKAEREKREAVEVLLVRQRAAKLELVQRAFMANESRLMSTVFLAWHTLVARDTNAMLMAAQERAANAHERAERAEAALDVLHVEVLQLKASANEANETIKLKLASRLGLTQSTRRQLMLIMQRWRQHVVQELAEQRRTDDLADAQAEREHVESLLELEKNRKASAHAARHLLGGAARCFIAWRSVWSTRKLEEAAGAAADRERILARQHGAERAAEDERAASQMANVLERMNRDRLMHLVARCVAAWRQMVGADKAGKLAGRTASALQDKDSLEAQLRLASAAREAEARRADMFKSEARLEGQARISQLEAALRRAELDAADSIRQAGLKAEEKRLTESQQQQRQLTELNSQLRLERLDKERLREEVRKEHQADLSELEQLRKQKASGGGGGDQKLITQLQMQLSELQNELRYRDEQHADGNTTPARSGGGGSGHSGGGSGGFWGGLFGGGDSSSPDALASRRSWAS